MFSNVFERFFLTYLAYTPQAHTLISLFNLRAGIYLLNLLKFPPKIPKFLKNPYFFVFNPAAFLSFSAISVFSQVKLG
jgi:hypothetical protein